MHKKKNEKLVSLPTTKKSNAIKKIRKVAENTSLVIFLDHAEMRMQEREISIAQVFRVLRFGDPKTLQWDTESERGWKCKFTRITAGARLSVVAKLVERGRGHVCLIISTFKAKS